MKKERGLLPVSIALTRSRHGCHLSGFKSRAMNEASPLACEGGEVVNTRGRWRGGGKGEGGQKRIFYSLEPLPDRRKRISDPGYPGGRFPYTNLWVRGGGEWGRGRSVEKRKKKGKRGSERVPRLDMMEWRLSSILKPHAGEDRKGRADKEPTWVLSGGKTLNQCLLRKITSKKNKEERGASRRKKRREEGLTELL